MKKLMISAVFSIFATTSFAEPSGNWSVPTQWDPIAENHNCPKGTDLYRISVSRTLKNGKYAYRVESWTDWYEGMMDPKKLVSYEKDFHKAIINYADKKTPNGGFPICVKDVKF